VMVRDFTRNHPDFESALGEDYDIVTNELGADKLPVYADNPSTRTTTGADNFNQWYRDVADVNIAIPMTIVLSETTPGMWEYSNTNFFPIDGMGWAIGTSEPTVLDDIYPNDWWNTFPPETPTPGPEPYDPDDVRDPKSGHNFHFTLESHLQFDYNGGEEFTFIGDDDLFVYINGKLAINIGGIHPAIRRTINLDEMAGELGIVPGERYSFDLFFAERHLTQSQFKFQTTINLECL
jgi:fibro-slime domain-containing protein